MTQEGVKKVFINVNDLSLRAEQLVIDLIRYAREQLPQIHILRNKNELEITVPAKMSKKLIKLRLKKYLYKKGLTGEFRPIASKSGEKDGYIVKEKRTLKLSYY